MMQPVALFLLIFVAILATNAAPEKTKKTFHLPLKRRHTHMTTRLNRRETYDFRLKHEGLRYTVLMSVGHPDQDFELVVDTVEPDILIADSTCSNCGNPPVMPVYSGRRSRSFKDLQTQYTWSDFHGIWSEDEFLMFDAYLRTQFVRGDKFPNSWVADGKISGWFGLGLHTSGPYPTLVGFLSESYLLDKKVISCRLVAGNNEEAGDILFGDIETKYVDGDIQMTYTINDNKNNWVIPILDVQFGHASYGAGNAEVDTAQLYIYLSTSIVDHFYANTGSKRHDVGKWLVPDPFPNDISFIIGERMFIVPKEAIPLRDLNKVDDMRWGAIQPTNDKIWALGMPFIELHYVVLDFSSKGNEQVGIGKRKP